MSKSKSSKSAKPAKDPKQRIQDLSRKTRWNRNGHLRCEVESVTKLVQKLPDLSDIPNDVSDIIRKIVTDYRSGDLPRQIAKRYNKRFEFVHNVCMQYGAQKQ